jgi:hypothetical protein
VAASAVTDALHHVWAALEPLNLPMALMGGLALAVWAQMIAATEVN